METKFDPRFQFSEWRQPLMDCLLKQQERLKKEGHERQIAILVDDIILSSRDEDALAHLCLRGRHFNISVLACAVSYTTLPKRCRRALDALFLFSCPMAGDCEILCREYANRSRMARYLLTQLPPWTCLVMETLERKQRLYHYRVPQTAPRIQELPASERDETPGVPDSSEENREQRRPRETYESSDCTQAAGTDELVESGQSEHSRPPSQI